MIKKLLMKFLTPRYQKLGIDKMRLNKLDMNHLRFLFNILGPLKLTPYPLRYLRIAVYRRNGRALFDKNHLYKVHTMGTRSN